MKPTKCNTCKGKRVKNEYRHGLSDTPPHPIEMSALSLPQPKTSECATCDGNRKSVYCPLCAKFYGKPLPIERTLERLSNPQTIEDVLMQVGAYGSGDSKHIAQAIKEFIAGKMPKEKPACNGNGMAEDYYWDGFNEAVRQTKLALGIE
jgi:hypothetical protein